jgi:hypothetical protein
MLPCWLPRLLLITKMHMNTSAAKRPTPTTDPITIPAMAPPDKLLPLAALVAEDETVAVEVTVVKVMVAVIVGSTTPAHRFSALEL